ncbi:MAG: lipoyl(octanoyl) transferase LipB, partial [Longimicrobiales bacterium]
MIDERRPLEVVRTGRIDYRAGLDLQAARVAARRAGTVSDGLFLVEHDHVLTLGTSTRREHLLLDDDVLRARGYEVVEVGRGGDVTYHGPGQLVGYPVLALEPERRDLHRYLRDLEEVLIRAVGAFGLRAGREEGLTGVWVPGGKLAAIGVRVSSGWITSHGFALNVDPALERVTAIVPCGIAARPVTSLARELGRAPDAAAVEAAV